MKMPVYSERDIAVGFGYPYVAMNDTVAKRNFAYKINNADYNLMNFSPKDFDLYKVGTFDTDTGLVSVENIPELVCSGISVFGVDTYGTNNQ